MPREMVRPSTLPDWVASRLRCPACQASALVAEGEGYLCGGCQCAYQCVNGVPDLAVTTSLPELRMYRDPTYRKWRGMLADSHDYFYHNPLVAWVQNAGHRRIRSVLDRMQAQDVLDLGCGDGAHLPFFRDKSRYLGLDIDQKSLVKLCSLHPDTAVIRADGYNLPFHDASFGCIIDIYNLEHMAFLDLALEEMRRVLRRDGVLLASVPCVDGLIANIARKISSSRHFTTDDFDYDRASELEHVNCIWQLDKAFRRHFFVKKRTLFPLNIPFLSTGLIATYELTVS